MSLRSDETWHRLHSWTYGQTPSERLAAQVLIHEGYTNVDPIHPLGGPDGGKDALAIRDGQKWIMAVYFPHDGRSYSDVKNKAVSDANGVRNNQAHGMAFITNQCLTDGERRSVTDAVGVPLDLFHLERVVTILDEPSMHGVRRQYLSIDYGTGANRTGPTEAELLEGALRAARTRRWQRLRAAGVTEERRTQVEGWMNTHRGQTPSVEAGVKLLLLSAPMGHGKTELAHNWFEARIYDAIESSTSPFPLWIRAREVAGPLERCIMDNIGRGNCSRSWMCDYS